MKIELEYNCKDIYFLQSLLDFSDKDLNSEDTSFFYCLLRHMIFEDDIDLRFNLLK